MIIGISYIKLILTYPIGYEWMCEASYIEVVSIDLKVSANNEQFLSVNSLRALSLPLSRM